MHNLLDFFSMNFEFYILRLAESLIARDIIRVFSDKISAAAFRDQKWKKLYSADDVSWGNVTFYSFDDNDSSSVRFSRYVPSS